MKALWIVLIAAGAVVILGAAAFFLFKRGPDLSSYLPLKDPRITHKNDERVLEVRFSGPADIVLPKAYSVLFKVYFGIKGSPKGPGMKPPKARFENLAVETASGSKSVAEFKAHDWTGSVAIPIPEDLVVSTHKSDAEGMAAREGKWAYGEVAEILHLGSYGDEPASIKHLRDFIAAKGYKIVGDHEEEYLKGPGMWNVTPKDYWTIIRYRVEKAD